MTRLIRLKPVGIRAVAVLLVVAWGAIASAHDGHENEDPHSPRLTLNQRTWTHASGRYQVHGSFVATYGDQVQVRKEDGGLLDITLGALSGPDRAWVEDRIAAIRRVNSGREMLLLAQRPAAAAGGDGQGPAPSLLAFFQPYEDTLKFRWDDAFFYVESNGIPDHRMMVGITAWQQQVPLPQKYTGDNAWRIPLHPVPAKQPMSAKENFFRGAIALAVNGVPIFNPIKNDGHTDTLLAGELDEFGGHCGRADDYHYHVAPVHLEPKTGKGKPLAYALDGYPIYGYDEPDGSKVQRLDAFNGHENDEKPYHYHATKTYPYLNGGFHGEVTERGGQVDPQPRAEPVREALPPLRGARITEFVSPKAGSYRLTYELRGKTYLVNYAFAPNGPVTFQFVDSAGKTTTETYERRGRGPGPGGGRGDRPPPEGGRRPPPPVLSALDEGQAGQTSTPDDFGALDVTSPAFPPGGKYPVDFTCDGAGVSPPIEWNGVPAGTRSFALNVWHLPGPGGIKSYWVVYNIPANVTSLPRNVKGIGVSGLNDKGRSEYDPMCSQGPGVKTYHITVFALSKELSLAPGQATRAELLRAIANVKLAQKTLTYQYERKGRD